MGSAETADVRSARRPAQRTSIALPAALALAIFAALTPILRVVAPGGWTAGVFVAVLAVLTTAWLCRRAGLASALVSLIAAGAGGVLLTLMFAGETALLWVLPTPATFRAIPAAVEAAAHEILVGSAPLIAGGDLSFVLVASAVVLTVALDHVVITTRMPLLASVALIAVYLIPGLAVHTSVRVPEFIGFSLTLLLLIALDTRLKERARTDPLPPAPTAPFTLPSTERGGAVGTAVAIGSVVIVIAVAVSPALPAPARPATGFAASGSAIDASLSLGDSLRQPEPIEVLRVQTDGITPPYLRAVTLSSFDGEVWQPDRGQGEPLTEDAFDPLRTDEEIRIIERTTTVEVVDYVSPWLPIPFPAVSVEGLDGEWLVLDENRTVLTRESTPQGQTYTVQTHMPRPSLEQIRASSATIDASGPRDVTSLHASRREIDPIREVAVTVTDGEDTDYDKLSALQTWFRTNFQYSLDAPVEDNFDGTGLDAIASFLEERKGYCVHFASAFAVMARTLDMPSRIVVGYLPGVGTGESQNDLPVYSVVSSSLHAWPEVYFRGIGWIPFEPTASLGTATRFWPASSGVVDDGGNPVDPVPSATPSTAPSVAPEQESSVEASDASTLGRAADPVPAFSLAVLALMVLATPSILRLVRRRRRLDAAEWDAGAGWDELLDTAIDLGIPLPPGESPRALGERLIREHAAPPDAMRALVAAIERTSYAPTSSRVVAVDLPTDVRAVRAALLAGASPAARARAACAPRSLLVRAGSAVAAGA